MDAAVASSNEFGWKLLVAEREQNSESNILFSSFGITTILSMLHVGTKGNTGKQIEEALNLKNEHSIHQKFQDLFKSLSSSTKDVILNIVNLLVVDASYSIIPDFSNCSTLNYSAETKQFNFESEAEKARKEINQLIETVTGERIKDMLSENSVSPDTKLMLISATCFKGIWKFLFDSNAISKQSFHTIKNEEIIVDMMYRKATYKYLYIENLKVSFLEIPYVGDTFSMVIILPDENDGLPNIEKSISVDDINKGIADMFERKNIALHLPKIKLEESLPLKDRLIQLGMTDSFGGNADLSGISEKRDLKISDIIHKAFVEVNEEGNEERIEEELKFPPIVVEENVIIRKCPIRTLNFIVDHPFMFIIRETTTGLMLFTGSVYKL